MKTKLDELQHDLQNLISAGSDIMGNLLEAVDNSSGTIPSKVAGRHLEAARSSYQSWYTEALSLVKQILPDRADEFRRLYEGGDKRKEIDSLTYSLADWCNGIGAARKRDGVKAFNDVTITCARFRTQFEILMATERRFESSLMGIRQLLQSDLFDSELDAARDMTKKNFLRSAGAIAGVVLERHLLQVRQDHNVSGKKRSPTIADLNESLKSADIIDVILWRQIQRLSDIRNLCVHKKERDPTKDEVNELIDGVDKISKTLF